MFYVGCPAWGYKDWVGNFFPAHTAPGNFLRLYSKRMSTVEGNTTFYAIPSLDTVKRWKRETAPTFRICPKVPRSVSHESRLENGKGEIEVFVERMRELGPRLGPMFLQLPPSFGPAQLPQLEALLAFWPPDIRLAIEVRQPSFFKEPQDSAFNDLLRQHNLARVMMDTRPLRVGTSEEQQILHARERKPDLPLRIASTTNFTFVRYIGHPRKEVNEPFLENWAKQLAEWLHQGITVYAFCHCPFEVYSPLICYTLYEHVRKLVQLPPLSWHPEQQETEFEQAKLF